MNPEAQAKTKEFNYGFKNEKRWIRGWVPVGKKRQIYVDSQTGEGVEEVLSVLNKFITYQAMKIKFPAYSSEDVAQELRMLALEAMPKYDITRNTNMITFLQNHLRNRIINMCKFVSEKRRRATFFNNDQIKVKCPDCKAFTRIKPDVKDYVCYKCGKQENESDKKWRKYNMPMVSIPFGSIAMDKQNSPQEEWSFIECVASNSTYLSFVKEEAMLVDKKVQLRADFMKVFDKLDETNKQIIIMVIEGHTYKDIAKKLGMSEKAAYARASKVIKSKNMGT